MITRCLAIALFVLSTANAHAAQLTPTLENGQLGVTIDSAAYPDTLRQELTSGLTNRILIRVRLTRGNEIVRQRAVEVAIRYDLWDEHFATTIAVDGVQTDARTLRNMEQVQSFLRRLPLPRLFATNDLDRSRPLTLSAEILLDPIDRERMDMIRKWVAQNNVGPSDIAGSGSSDVAVAIFNNIFEQYAKGADIAAVWRETSLSPPFRLDELAQR